MRANNSPRIIVGSKSPEAVRETAERRASAWWTLGLKCAAVALILFVLELLALGAAAIYRMVW